jgi:hypothetical protein
VRPGLHRYHPDLHPTRRLPAFRVVRSHRRPRSGWPPWAAASVMVVLGALGFMVTLTASRGPTVGPVHAGRPPVAGRPLVPQDVASDPPVDQGDDQGDDGPGQQRGDDQASRSTPRPVPTSTGLADPPLGPAAGNEAPATPSPLSLPELSSPPPMAVPSPSLSPGSGVWQEASSPDQVTAGARLWSPRKCLTLRLKAEYSVKHQRDDGLEMSEQLAR